MDRAGKHLYFHVPFCDGKCAYCGFYSEVYSPQDADRCLDSLEIEAALRLAGTGVAPETVYFGGGTPSILSAAQLERLCRIVKTRSLPRPATEWTVEANPGTLTPGKLRVLREAGVNRISVGAQSFDDAVLRHIGRRHSAAAISGTVAAIRSAGIENIGLDLIAALPGVDDDTWRATLMKAVELDPRHISVYALTIEHGSRMATPDDDSQLRAMEQAESVLSSAGYLRYEISNYAKPGFEAKHNVSCWRGEDYLGLGPAAAARSGLKRWTNKPGLGAYSEALAAGCLPPRDEETVTPETDAAERLAFAFRLAEGVDLRKFEAIAGSRVGQWQETLRKLGDTGLTEYRDGRWFLTAKGIHLADYVAGELMG